MENSPFHVWIINNKKFSDVAVVTKDNTSVYTVSTIIDVRCPKLYTKDIRLRKGAKLYLENPIIFKENLLVLLHYLYSGYLPHKCAIEDLVSVIAVAEYLEVCTPHFVNEIYRKIYSLCSRKNVFKLFARCNDKVIKEIYRTYIGDHWDSLPSEKLSEIQVFLFFLSVYTILINFRNQSLQNHMTGI